MIDCLKHITVCICTFKRPSLLERLLKVLEGQRTDGVFSYSIVVVDNDRFKSAQQVVESAQAVSNLVISYYIEPQQNIAMARNRAVDNAKGDLIAFIDDDEFPSPNWLYNLLDVYSRYKPDGVLGPVKPHFDEKPPVWLVKGKFCERPLVETGTMLHWDQTRTGNVLLSKNIFTDEKNRFDPRFGRTGGEDSEFFEAMIKQGYVFVWCNEAVVYETVTPDRFTQLFYIKKFLRIGGLTGEKARNWPHWYKHLARTVTAFAAYSVVLPFSILGGQHLFIKVFTKTIYFAGWILGFLGLVVLRYRN